MIGELRPIARFAELKNIYRTTKKPCLFLSSKVCNSCNRLCYCQPRCNAIKKRFERGIVYHEDWNQRLGRDLLNMDGRSGNL